MRAPGKSKRRTAAPILSARLSRLITLETEPDGTLAVNLDGYSDALGTFSTGTVQRAQELCSGLPLDSFGPDVDNEIDLLVHRLARRGLLEYRLGRAGDDNDQVVIEPQVPEYWPHTPDLGDADRIVLSRFAYLRRRGNDMVLESPRAGALFRIGDPKIAAALAVLSTPQQLKKFRRQDGFPGIELLALLLDCQMLLRIDADGGDGLRATEGDGNLVMWDFHDLLFHARSTEGRQANPLGGLYPYARLIAPPPAVRPPWPGKKINLQKLLAAPSPALSRLAKLMDERHSSRDFDDRQPITLAELARFLDASARVRSKWTSEIDLGDDSPVVAYASRPYPSAGSAYELELYLSVANCAGLARGFYHYDADQHALVPIGVAERDLDAQLAAAGFAMDAAGMPQILITIAARFDRLSWKYRSIAYSLILKDVGVLLQTLYLMATDMKLGGCAIGTGNIDRFAKMTGIEFHVEGPVGQFALGRASESENSG